MSFANIPPVLDLSYLSVSPRSWGVSAMGNLVEGDSGADSYVHAVRAVLVTWAPASDWPEWAERDSSGYSHEVEAAIYEIERNGAGTLTNFEPLIASRSLVHVPWRPTEAPDGSPYPYNGHAFEVAIPFVESVELPDEYMVLISYNTESQGTNPLGDPGPYNALNYGLSRSEVRSGNDSDPSSLVQITPQGWNYSASWGGLGSLMTEVVSRSAEEMEEVPSEQPARVGEYLTAFYEEGEFVEQATVRILPRPITLRASPQERVYGDAMVLDETAFTVTDLDGDSALPNGEVIDTVALHSATGVDISTTSNVGTYADEIVITAQAGSNGFSVGNYDLSYVAGDLVVNPRAVTLAALPQERIYGDASVLDDTAFTVTDLDGDIALPHGELIDTVILNSDVGANVGTYADAISIAGQAGSNGFSSGNYDLTYVAGNLVVNQRAVTLTALPQERIYGDAMALDETAFTVTDFDGDNVLPNGEAIDMVTLSSVTGVDITAASNVGAYADEIEITGQSGSSGFSASNYDLSYVTGDLVVSQRAVTLTASQQDRIYGDTLVLDETAFTVTDLDGDNVLPSGEVIDTVTLSSVTGVDITATSNVGAYADEIEITGQAGSSGFSASNYDLSYVTGDLVVSQRAVTLTASQQDRIYGDTLVLDEMAFTVTDFDGDNALPNGEAIDTVTLSSVTGVDITATSNVGIYADEIAITGQSGSNGFSAGNYDLTYVDGDLVVNQRAVTVTALQQERSYGNAMVFDETAFTVTDLDSDSMLPNGELIDTVTLNSVTGVDVTTTADLGAYVDEIEIMGQAGSNGFDADNYDLSYVAGDLVVVARTYEEWIQSFLQSGSISPLDDPDLDGLTNVMEYALGSNPLSGTDRSPVEVSSDGVFSGQISVELFATTVVLERSLDLQNWVEITPDYEEAGLFRAWQWSDPGRRRSFVRLRVERTL